MLSAKAKSFPRPGHRLDTSKDQCQSEFERRIEVPVGCRIQARDRVIAATGKSFEDEPPEEEDD